MYDFNYHRAADLGQAGQLLTGAEDAKLLAGGQTLIPTMKQRLAAPSDIVDIGKMGALGGIERAGRELRIGAIATHFEVATSQIVQQSLPALAKLASMIGDPHVRHRGTIGGSLANNDPAADYPAALLALNGTIMTNKRELDAESFFTGMFETALDEDEIITAVRVPFVQASAYTKFPNPASRYALVGVFVSQTGDGAVRVAVTGAGQNGVFRARQLEDALGNNFSADALAGQNIDPDELIGDIHATAEYRAHLIVVMAKRAVAAIG